MQLHWWKIEVYKFVSLEVVVVVMMTMMKIVFSSLTTYHDSTS